MSEKRPTTAQALVAYRLELVEGGFTEEQAFCMARDAAQELLRCEGLGIREPDPITIGTVTVDSVHAKVVSA